MSSSNDDELKIAQETFTNDSAFMIAYERSLESSLFQDPFAQKLAGTKGQALSDAFGSKCAPYFNLWPDFHKTWTVVRTKFIDDHLASLTASGAWQIVNLGAGLDTRAYRLPCAAAWTAAFEVDMDEINGPKARIFGALGAEPKTRREVVSADLRVRGGLTEALKNAGFDAACKTAFLAEGLVMYLGDDAWGLLEEIGELAAPGSALIVNFVDAGTASQGVMQRERVQKVLEAGGWERLRFSRFGEKDLDFGRFKEGYDPSPAFSFVVGFKI